MIRLKQLLREMSENDLNRCLDKIRNKQFRLIGAGDNGRVYEIDGEDKAFKVTKEQDEYEVADIIVNRYNEFTTFIPVYYVNEKKLMYVMAKADRLNVNDTINIEQFMKSYKNIEISSTLNTTENNHNRVWLLYDTNIINSSIINNSNISVGKLPNSNTNLSANSININNDDTNSNVVCVTDNQGKECLNTADIYHLSKMPLVFDTNDNICLYDSNKIPVCIGKEELQMLSGKRNFKLKIINTNNPYQNTFLNQKTDNISTGGVLQVSYYNNNEQISVGRNLTGYGLGTTEDEGQDFSFYINTPSDGVPVESIKCADCKP